LHSNLESAILS